MRRHFAVAVAFCTLLLAGAASAYTLVTTPPSRWPNAFPADEVLWVMNEDGCPDMSPEQTETILERSFQTWEDVDCANIGFDYDGRTNQTTTGMDGVQLMVWREPEDGWRYGSAALGVTGSWYDGRGTISDADIEFNSVNYTWSDGGGGQDLQSVATHEIGHLLGLGHTEIQQAQMYPYDTGLRTLHSDDIAGVCFLYPDEGGGCDTDDDCPPGYECRAGDCVATGGGEVCDPCSEDEQCGDTLDLCVPYSRGGSRCGHSCANDSDCDGIPGCESRVCTCEEMSGRETRQCAAAGGSCDDAPECDNDDHCGDGEECVDGECVERGCEPLGNSCDDREDCCSGLCLDGECSTACDWLDPANSCQSGFYCEIQECGVGFCREGSLGGSGRGADCLDHAACSTGYCGATGGQTQCQIPCDPDGMNSCPDDWNCLQIGASACGLCACRIGRLGDPVEDDFGCASGLSVRLTEYRCTRYCNDDNPCPDGYSCVEGMDGDDICWPPSGGFGAECSDDDDCPGGECVNDSCTRECDTDCDCPPGNDCGGDGVCVVGGGGSDRGCGCATAGASRDGASVLAGGSLLALFAFFAFLRARRRV